MARGKKTDAKKIAKVITDKIEKPDISVRDLARKNNISKSTAHDIVSKQGANLWTKSDYTQQLLDVNISILSKGKEIIEKELHRLGTEEGIKINSVQDIKSLSSVMEDAFKQNQLLNGDNTENSEIKIKFIA